MSIPFFRGKNYADWLVAILAQSGADWEGESGLESALAILGPCTVRAFDEGVPRLPPVYLAYTDDYVFIVSGSTHGAIQWVGNVLGSSAIDIETVPGKVPQYFGYVANSQAQLIASDLIRHIGSRKPVFIGYSLGAASVTIMKAIFKNSLPRDAACFAFACPRTGDEDFINAFPNVFYQRILLEGDMISSVPPTPWSSFGKYFNYIPVGPLVNYASPGPSYVFNSDSQWRDGEVVYSLLDALSILASGEEYQVHQQKVYADAIRTFLPEVVDDGFEGLPLAGLIDEKAPKVLIPGLPWRWGSGESDISTSIGGSTMPSQIGIFIRSTDRQKGFEEVYYSATDASKALLDRVGAQMIVSRQKFLAPTKSAGQGVGFEIYAWRVSKVGSPRASFLARPPVPLPGLLAELGGPAIIEACAIYQGLSADGTSKRSFHFRGLDSGYIVGETIIPNGTLDTLINNPSVSSNSFRIAMNNCGVIILSKNAVGAGYTVSAAAQAVPGAPITLTTNNAGPFVTGSLWNLRGVRAPNNILNGVYQAQGNPGNGLITLSGSGRYSAPSIISGRLTPIGPVQKDLGELVLTGAGKKDTGRPPFSPRGRQSAVLRRR